MRARLGVLVVFAVVAAIVAAPAAFASGRNPQTAGLQVALRAQGLYRGAIDAVSGPKTVAAVRAFQRIHGLRVTGIADARTRKALGPLGRPLFGARTLQRGAFGVQLEQLVGHLPHASLDAGFGLAEGLPTEPVDARRGVAARVFFDLI